MLDILNKIGWSTVGGILGSFLVIIFQVIKWFVNNKKMKKEFSSLREPKVVDVADKIDYDVLADLIIKKVESKKVEFLDDKKKK